MRSRSMPAVIAVLSALVLFVAIYRAEIGVPLLLAFVIGIIAMTIVRRRSLKP